MLHVQGTSGAECVRCWQDVRENGEQQVGEEVEYWETHDGDIGTGSGADYP
jgi:hypothetical protein